MSLTCQQHLFHPVGLQQTRDNLDELPARARILYKEGGFEDPECIKVCEEASEYEYRGNCLGANSNIALLKPTIDERKGSENPFTSIMTPVPNAWPFLRPFCDTSSTAPEILLSSLNRASRCMADQVVFCSFAFSEAVFYAFRLVLRNPLGIYINPPLM